MLLSLDFVGVVELLLFLEFLLELFLVWALAEGVDLDEPGDGKEDPVDDCVDKEADVFILGLGYVEAVSGLEDFTHHEDEDCNFEDVKAEVADARAEESLAASDDSYLLDDVSEMHDQNEVERVTDP